MGHDHHQQSSSSGVVAAVLVAFLLLAILGIVLVAVVGIRFARKSTMLSRVEAYDQLVVAEAHEAEAIVALQDQPRIAATSAKTVSVRVQLDHLGDASIDGEKVGLDTLKAQLTALKQETNTRLSLEINVDSECLFKHVLPVMNLYEEVGDIDFRFVSADALISSTVENAIQE